MKKLAYLSSLLLLATATTSASAAGLSTTKYNTKNISYYVGADYEYTNIDYDVDSNNDLLASDFHGGNIHGGIRLGQYLGFEAGYFLTGRASKNGNVGMTPVSTDTKIQGLYVDGIGYYPLTKDRSLEVLGSIGLGYYRLDSDLSAPGVTNDGSSDEIASRLGIGLQYNITPSISARTIANYVLLEENYWTGRAGLNFNF